MADRRISNTLKGKVMSTCVTPACLYCIVLYCIVLYCIVLYCIVLYCIDSTFALQSCVYTQASLVPFPHRATP